VNRDFSIFDNDLPLVFRPQTQESGLSSTGNLSVSQEPIPILSPSSVLTFNTPLQGKNRKTDKNKGKNKKEKEKEKVSQSTAVSSSSQSISPSSSFHYTSNISPPPYSGTGNRTLSNSSINSSSNSTTNQQKRRRSSGQLASLLAAMQAGNNSFTPPPAGSSRAIYSHIKQTRSISIVRKSSTSSRGQSQSLSESFQNINLLKEDLSLNEEEDGELAR
jgi:hypothetical protein